MEKERAIVLLNSVIDYFSVSEKNSEVIEKLLHIGFTGDELIEDFEYSLTDVRAAELRAYNGPVDSWEDMRLKYPIDRDDMTEEMERAFVNDCFYLYEKEGFSDKFWTPYEDEKHMIGQPFEVIGRCPEEQNVLCVLPLWNIRFKNGRELCVHPEEVIPSEMRANGCRFFDKKKPAIEELINEAKDQSSGIFQGEKKSKEELVL